MSFLGFIFAIDWDAPEEIAKLSLAYRSIIHVFTGIYLWEYIVSFDFEWAYITRKRKFRWPLLVYFAGRYMILGYMIALLISVNVTTELNCQALLAFMSFAGSASVGFASLSLALRAVAVWNRHPFVVGALTILSLGHWALILQGGRVTAEYSAPIQGCVITSLHQNITITTMVYSMVYDFIVVCLVTYKLAFPRSQKTQLVQRLYKDGIFYFLVVFTVTCFETIMLFVNLSFLLDAIFLVPGAVISSISANRAVRRLSNFFGNTSSRGQSDSTAGQISGGHTFRLNTRDRRMPQVTVTTEINADNDSTDAVKAAPFPNTDPEAGSVGYDHTFPPTKSGYEHHDQGF